ncbi:MAG: hypothetical protein ACREFQ_04615 [Stellaceae bacterium]
MVIVLGVLLVLGAAGLVAAVVERVEGRRPSALRQAESLHVPLPAGARILTVELVGDRLMVRAALVQGGESIFLIDARTGRLIAIIGASNKPYPCRCCGEGGEKIFHGARFFLETHGDARIYPPRDAIRTCLWPIVVMQRRSASFLADPVTVGRSREGGRYGCNPTQGRSALP